MGFIANYMMIDEPTLERFMKLDGEELTEAIDELEESGNNDVYCMDKLWDGLHFLMTGVSASEPIDGNKLSESIVGVHVFDVKDFVACTEYEELEAIVLELEKVDMEELLSNVDFSKFKKKKIYPDIWYNNERAQLAKELKQEWKGLLDFYKKSISVKMHVIVSIY